MAAIISLRLSSGLSAKRTSLWPGAHPRMGSRRRAVGVDKGERGLTKVTIARQDNSPVDLCVASAWQWSRLRAQASGFSGPAAQRSSGPAA